MTDKDLVEAAFEALTAALRQEATNAGESVAS